MQPHYTTQAPDYAAKENPSAFNRTQTMQLVKAEKMREASNQSTTAWEITLKCDLPKGHPNIQAGMQIALYPINDDACAERVLKCLKNAPLVSKIDVHLPKRDGVDYGTERMNVKSAIAHTIDLTRPSKQLLYVFGIDSDALSDAERKAYGDMSVEEFLEQQAERGKKIDFKTLAAAQPPLGNRKYTPSDINPEEGTIKLLISEVQHGEHRGTTTGYIHDVIRKFQQTDKPQPIRGFLDVRDQTPEIEDPQQKRYKHKLPYHEAAEGAPKIFLSTGVGIAPHLAWLRQEARAGHAAGAQDLLYSGVRTPADELGGAEVRSALGDRYHRITSPTRVQDALFETPEAKEKLWHLLTEEHAVFYLCGHEAMKDGLEKNLKALAEAHGQNGETFVKDLEKNGQLQHSVSYPDRHFTKHETPKAVAAFNEAFDAKAKLSFP